MSVRWIWLGFAVAGALLVVWTLFDPAYGGTILGACVVLELLGAAYCWRDRDHLVCFNVPRRVVARTPAVSNYHGLVAEADFPATKSSDRRFIVGIFGGSVAAAFSREERRAIAGKFNEAFGGWDNAESFKARRRSQSGG
jgi:hypothetical protein